MTKAEASSDIGGLQDANAILDRSCAHARISSYLPELGDTLEATAYTNCRLSPRDFVLDSNVSNLQKKHQAVVHTGITPTHVGRISSKSNKFRAFTNISMSNMEISISLFSIAVFHSARSSHLTATPAIMFGVFLSLLL